jgi:predicted RNA-binding Zn-ribbon protein involved in translation (DUF1610 family)
MRRLLCHLLGVIGVLVFVVSASLFWWGGLESRSITKSVGSSTVDVRVCRGVVRVYVCPVISFVPNRSAPGSDLEQMLWFYRVESKEASRWRPSLRVAPPYYQLGTPMWILVVSSAVVAAWGLWPRRVRMIGRCGYCGYDLKGLQKGVCPECGAPLDSAYTRPTTTGRPRDPARECRGCQYDLAGIRASVCPECGTQIEVASKDE